jgi:ring-1,2-phenylacetyl-CoA epoxidase subunit PaaD
MVKYISLNQIEKIYSLLEQVSDPEIPVLSVLDLGMVRDVICKEEEVEVIITPTYSGCPATDAIAFDIKLKLLENGYSKVKVTYTLTPAWTTDWMTQKGKIKLKEYGIAPPKNKTANQNNSRIHKMLFEEEDSIECPRCQSTNTVLLSQFGSTACKALHQCLECKEPFDYFKCH